MINNRFLRLLLASSPLLVAVGLYGYAVYLPFFLDDGLLFTIIMRPPNSPLSWEIWGGSMTFVYYRPFVFSIWEINQSLMGGGKFDPIALHWLNVMMYGMTGVLLGAFIRRLGRLIQLPYRAMIGGFAGLIYVIFPFNYNAVIWVASMFHIFAGFGTVLTLWCVVGYLSPISLEQSVSNRQVGYSFLRWTLKHPARQKTGKRTKGAKTASSAPLVGLQNSNSQYALASGGSNERILPELQDSGKVKILWLIGAWFGTFIATFSHENGVLIAPLVGLLLLWILIGRMNRITLMRIAIIYIPILIIIAIYWVLLNTVPRGASPLAILWDDLFDSSALFIQTLIYPVIGAYRKLTLADESIPTFWLLGGLTIIPTWLFILWQSRPLGKFALYGLMWFVIASLPTVLFLSTEYVRGSWRLMLFAGIGAGIYWSTFILALYRSGWLGRVLMTVFIGWSAFMSINFLSQRQHEAGLQANYNDQLQTLTQANTQGKPLVINAPSFLASTFDQQWLPTRETGVMFHAGYVNHAQVFRAQTGYDFPRIETLIDYDIFTVAPNQNFAPFSTLDGVSELDAVRNATDIYVTVWDGEHFRPMFVGGMGFDGEDEPIAIFPNHAIALTEATATRTAPNNIQFRTRWRVDTPPIGLVFLVLDAFCDGQIVGQSIGATWGGMYPFHLWTAGEIHTDFRDVRLLRDVPNDCLSLQVSLIDWDGDGTPYPVQSPDGEPMRTPQGENRMPVVLVE